MAVTDKDPTEAIQLVEQTIGTFNQIVVGKEGQMVPVPGYPDQPTLAERVKQNIKPSTDAAAGFATQAAASAKAADDSAKLASQISGLETVADAIGLATLPLPDVWAPLSDSLRLITGYGREVLVGSDVVARMVNFSRSTTEAYSGKDGLLKTAAVNEPGFEKDGLQVEGQSTNLFKVSDAIAAPSAAAVATTVVTDESLASFTSIINKTKVIRAVQTTNAPGNTITLQTGVFSAGKTYTVSCWCRTDAGATMQFRFQPNGFSPAPLTVTGDKWGRMSITFTLPADYASSGDLLVSINQGAYLNIPLYFTGLQVEELPFASSYIPTAGAAVTRAAGACLLPYAGNGIPASEMQMTMSAVIKTNPRPGEPTALIDAMDITPNVGVFLSPTGQIDTRIFDVQWTPGITPDMTKEQVVALSFNGATGAVAMRVGDKVVTVTVVVPKGISRSAGNIGLLCRSGTNTRTGFGSVRDFKIWHKYFTVDQLKAIK